MEAPLDEHRSMPYVLRISKALRKAGWTVKVYDREGPETPHVTIRCKAKTWRVSLRGREFLFPGGTRGELPDELWETLTADVVWQEMERYWDARNPHNPVTSEESEETE